MGVLEAQEGEQAAISEARALRGLGLSLRAVASRLEEQGYRTRTGQRLAKFIGGSAIGEALGPEVGDRLPICGGGAGNKLVHLFQESVRRLDDWKRGGFEEKAEVCYRAEGCSKDIIRRPAGGHGRLDVVHDLEREVPPAHRGGDLAVLHKLLDLLGERGIRLESR
jgi:hypothetical protein